MVGLLKMKMTPLGVKLQGLYNLLTKGNSALYTSIVAKMEILKDNEFPLNSLKILTYVHTV